MHQSRNKAHFSYDFPRSEIIQNLSNLISSIDYIVRPTNGNFGVCGQAKKMLQAILDTVLAPQREQAQAEIGVSGDVEQFQAADFDDQTWLFNNFDMDFWTKLEDHPMLGWPDVPEDIPAVDSQSIPAAVRT